MFDYNYRLWLLKYLASVFVPPLVVFIASIHGLQQLGHLMQNNMLLPCGLVYLALTPMFWTAVWYFTEWRSASTEGALYIPSGGWHFNWSIASIHKRRDLWGPDADEFVPDRWLDESGKESAIPNSFLPWGAGPR